MAGTKANPNDPSSNYIINGYEDGTFKPQRGVSFIESLAIIMKTGEHAQYIPSKTAGEAWFTPLVKYYNENFAQSEKSFKNNQEITRDFAMYLILKQADISFENVYTKTKFSDVDPYSIFAPYIDFANYAGIVRGYRDGRFGAKNSVTRAEISVMTWKTLRKNKEGGQQKYNEYMALKWLEQNNRKYEDLSSVISAIGSQYGSGSAVTLEANKLLQSGAFTYNYKTVVKKGNTGKSVKQNEASRQNHTGWDGYTNSEIAEVMRIEYIQSVVGYVESGRKQGGTDEQILKMAAKSYGEGDQKYNHIKYYMETGKKDFYE